jgi:hypothetical protein
MKGTKKKKILTLKSRINNNRFERERERERENTWDLKFGIGKKEKK